VIPLKTNHQRNILWKYDIAKHLTRLNEKALIPNSNNITLTTIFQKLVLIETEGHYYV
jgi:hypothetical protein